MQTSGLRGPLRSWRSLRVRIRSLPAPKKGRSYSALHNNFASNAISETSVVQAYRSRSTDPFVNLSIEHFLLEKTPPHSTVLFIYVNRPCVVIGRNQNPWLETNLSALSTGLRSSAPVQNDGVLLVRRRSGGGAVFHDEGNLNYSVICPPGNFHRDKHAEMMVRALRRAGAEGTGRHLRVNERHDIVLDAPLGQDQVDEDARLEGGKKTVKVSGSAYKLTRHRALHHGTCLLSSPRLKQIGSYLRSPANAFIKAKGVESVRSPVGNLLAESNSSAQSLIPEAVFSEINREFFAMYDSANAIREDVGETTSEGVPRIVKGIEELKSLEWKYLQTPQFMFSSQSTDDDPRPRPSLPAELPSSTRVFLRVKSGVILESHISLSPDAEEAIVEAKNLHARIQGRRLYEMGDWVELLSDGFSRSAAGGFLAHWLARILSTAT